MKNICLVFILQFTRAFLLYFPVFLPIVWYFFNYQPICNIFSCVLFFFAVKMRESVKILKKKRLFTHPTYSCSFEVFFTFSTQIYSPVSLKTTLFSSAAIIFFTYFFTPIFGNYSSKHFLTQKFFQTPANSFLLAKNCCFLTKIYVGWCLTHTLKLSKAYKVKWYFLIEVLKCN